MGFNIQRCSAGSLLFSLAAILLFASPAPGGVGEWKIYTAKREVRDAVTDNARGMLWAATSGGLFSYRFADGAFEEYTTAEGLRTIDLTALTIDGRGRVWTGASNGFLHSYDPRTRQWQYVSDLVLLNAPQKRINALTVAGDSLVILSGIGVSILRMSTMEFEDSYRRFGTGASQITGDAIALEFFNGRIWVATRRGVASTPLSNPNPSVPESWTVYGTAQGLPSDDIRGIVVSGAMLLAATSSGVARLDILSSAWRRIEGTAGVSVQDLRASESSPSQALFVAGAELWQLDVVTPDSARAARTANGFSSPLTAVLNDSVLGTQAAGMLVRRAGTWSAHYPAGPPSNRFIGLAVDGAGVVWSGSGTANGNGFVSFDGARWRQYSTAQEPRLGNDNYYKVSIGRDNSKWIGNWGAGIALVDGAGELRDVIRVGDGLLPSLEEDAQFVVVGGVAVDRRGVTWITNRTPPTDTAAVLFHPDSSISYVTGRDLRPTTVFTDVLIDQNNTKWFANFSRFEPYSARGLYFYNESNTLPGTAGGWGLLTENEGLTSNQVWSLALGKDGELWIGSEQGISILFSPGNPRIPVAAYHPLRDQIIQQIVVDPLNNKWVATRQGVFVLSPDGTSILERYTVESTQGKLLDNDVASIAMDTRNGSMYFGTEKGLSRLSTSAITPVREFDEIICSPNPWRLPSARELTIDGLVQGSTIKILTVDGSLVREIRSPGGRIGFWDGRTTDGALVASGVYLVVAYSEDGSKVVTGKVAVIRD